MEFELSAPGAVGYKLASRAHQAWREAISKQNFNLEGFDPDAPFRDRVAWALRCGLEIATVYARFSSKLQHSTSDQVRECILWAAQHGMFVPVELISMDEAVKGKRVRREGLDRMKAILKGRHATVLLVFKASRLFRQAFKGYQLVQEEVVDEGLRAVSVSQGIDTDDKKSWKIQMQAHGMVDDLLIDAIADHVRAGLVGLFLMGWTTGAIGVGYRRKELPEAPRTKRGLPRTIPEVDPLVAEMICEHARLLLEGMPLQEGLRRWLATGGPYDPRSTIGCMSYEAYCRLFQNSRLTGRWEFGRKRNQFHSKLDYTKQIAQPESEVSIFQCEELRILDDETYLALQAMFRPRKKGPRGPRNTKQAQLWDLTTEMFLCAHCSQPDKPVRFYQTGARGKGMQCKNRLCPCRSAVRRKEAVCAVCQTLSELITRDQELIEGIVGRSRELDVHGDEHLRKEIASLENSLRTLARRIEDLYELLGTGTEEHRKEILARIRAAQSDRVATQLELSRRQKELQGSSSTLTPEALQALIADMSQLLIIGAAGNLGEDAVYKALAVFRRLTGGQIWVRVEKRQGRMQTIVRGVFSPHLVRAVKEHAELFDGMHRPAKRSRSGCVNLPVSTSWQSAFIN